MWDWLKNAAKKGLELGAEYLEYKAFIDTLFTGTQEVAIQRLHQRVQGMSDREYKGFITTLYSLIATTQSNLQQLQAQARSGGSWGSTFEDQYAQFMAGASTGPTPEQQQAITMTEGYLQGLNSIAQLSESFHNQALLDRPMPEIPVAGGIDPVNNTPRSKDKSPSTDMTEIERLLLEFAETGELSPDLYDKLLQINDPDQLDRVNELFMEQGAHDISSAPPLNIVDYYKDGPGLFTLRWPLNSGVNLPLPFEQLDRETQFYVLFTEWTRRETEGMMALNQGQLDQAEAIFQECADRARQLGVDELLARSFEGLIRVAQKRYDPQAEKYWIQQALQARASSLPSGTDPGSIRSIR
jgi:hypothetical protein